MPQILKSADEPGHPRNANNRDKRIDRGTVTPKLKDQITPRLLDVGNNGFLSAPLSGPIRPLSPDTLSNLSMDEYEQIAPVQKFWVRNLGLVYMIVGSFFGCLMNVTTRKLEVEGNKGQGLHPFQILFARMGITFVLSTGYMFWKNTPDFPFGKKEVRGLLVMRGIGGFAGVFGMYYSLLTLPLADATVVTFLAPSLSCWACSYLINQPYTRVEKIAGVVSLVGVIFITRPTTLFATLTGSDVTPPASGNSDMAPYGNSTVPADASNYDDVTPVERLRAVGIALIGVLGSATAYTTIRWVGKRAHPLISVNYFAATCFAVSIIMQNVLPDIGFILPADLKEWSYLIFLGVCGFVMQFLLAAGLSYEKSSRATNMAYSQLIFAIGFDKLIFGHTPDLYSFIGSFLITGAAITIALQQNPDQGNEQNKNDNGTEGDEESSAGTMIEMEDAPEQNTRPPVQDVQLRTLG
ncbi:hypothetical protein LTR37_012999 [Vermiconidia calcicola]|uniref:Uncharacterized protein n=1 Tax=Vermiconidia calcicola TaxID=1690605 RepID=A0ACC3MXQ3_9PEZI|nr:hypothetical protein LTR37_012999 [Vermiconidia calcicola]